MNKVKLEILGLSSSQAQAGTFALVLGEENSLRRLVIVIGMFEAQAIALEMEKVASRRPMTHDLFTTLGKDLQFNLEEVLISGMQEGIFYSEMVIWDERGKRHLRIDARPSDAIAIALRFKAPVFVTEKVMREAAIFLDDEEENEEQGQEKEIPENFPAQPEPPSFQEQDLKSLRQQLDEAIAEEDYERAAQIRDELNRRGEA